MVDWGCHDTAIPIDRGSRRLRPGSKFARMEWVECKFRKRPGMTPDVTSRASGDGRGRSRADFHTMPLSPDYPMKHLLALLFLLPATPLFADPPTSTSSPPATPGPISSAPLKESLPIRGSPSTVSTPISPGLMGIQGKVLDEEIPGREVAGISTSSPDSNRRTPINWSCSISTGTPETPGLICDEFHPAHFLYFEGTRILDDVPAEDWRDRNPRGRRRPVSELDMGRYRTDNDDIGLCMLDAARSSPDWNRSEQVRLIAIDPAAEDDSCAARVLRNKAEGLPQGQSLRGGARGRGAVGKEVASPLGLQLLHTMSSRRRRDAPPPTFSPPTWLEAVLRGRGVGSPSTGSSSTSCTTGRFRRTPGGRRLRRRRQGRPRCRSTS